MSLNLFFILGCLICINFIIRFAPRAMIRYYGDDTWAYFTFAEHIRKKDDISKFYGGSLVDEICYEPLFLSKLLSYIPKKTAERYQGFISPIFDTLNLMILLWFSFYLYGSMKISALVGIFYIFYYPISVQCLSLNTRTLGYLVFTVSIVSLEMFFYTKNNIFIIIFILSSGLLLNTNRMATQAFIFTILGLGISYRHVYFIFLFLIILIIALIFSKGQYLQVIKGHIMNVKFHLKSIFSSEIGKYQSGRLSVAIAKLLLWGGILLLSFRDNATDIEKFLYIWALVLLLAFFFTTFIKPLRCLGEGYRYLDYSVIPVSIIFSKAIVMEQKVSTLVLLLIYILMSIIQIIRHYKIIEEDYTNIIDDDRFEVFAFLRSTSKKRVFCLPNGMSHSVVYFAKKKVLWVYFAWHKVAWLFPQISLPSKIPFKEIIKKYNLDYILLHIKFAAIEQLKLDSYRLAFSKGNYRLLEVS